MIKKIYLYIFCSFILIMISRAQDIETYNALYTKTYLETSQTDFPTALHIADSLYTISKTPLLEAQSLMLTASLYQQVGETTKAIEYGLKAENIIKSTNHLDWKTRIYGFLATQYRIAQLLTPAREYIEKAMNIAEKISDPQLANAAKGLIMQEKAYYKMEQKQYKEAITYIQRSKKYLEDTKQIQFFAIMENEQLLGLVNYLLGDEENALKHYEIALNLTTNIPKNHITALIHNGFANIYLNRNDLSKAAKHLNMAQGIADLSHYLHLKKEVNETAYRYYSSINDISKIRAIKKAQDSIITTIYRQSADFLNSSYTTLGREKDDMFQKSKDKLIFIFIGILIVLPMTRYFFLSPSNQKLSSPHIQQAKTDDVINKDNTQAIPNERNLSSSDKDPESESCSSPLMLEQTLNKILNRLEEFENKQLYIKRDVSLSYLATYCDTNAKYLSVVINSYKKKDFFNYINELRINYIIEKLTNNSYYRRLKVAALAREAGFSSQSKFALNFKKVTSVSPSEFIKSLMEE